MGVCRLSSIKSREHNDAREKQMDQKQKITSARITARSRMRHPPAFTCTAPAWIDNEDGPPPPLE